MKTQIMWVAVLLASLSHAYGQGKIARKELMNVKLERREITGVEVVNIEFPAGQKAPLHKHPCPVVGQITSGVCILQVEGKEAQILKTGDSFYEPANTPILHFDNQSGSAAMTFTAYYLTNGEKSVVELLPTGK
jgi:quercetin dioxygenase-like cupin family protein